MYCCIQSRPFNSNQPVSPGRYFLWKLVTVVLIQTAWQDSFTWPLVIFLLSCCIYPLASSCAHTFSSMSARARHICFFFDYGALSFYSLGKCVWFTVARFTLTLCEKSYCGSVLCTEPSTRTMLLLNFCQ